MTVIDDERAALVKPVAMTLLEPVPITMEPCALPSAAPSRSAYPGTGAIS